MAYDENIYARIVSGELSEEEINNLKKTGEWDEIQKILKTSEEFSLPSLDKDKGFADLMERRSSKSKIKSKKRLLNPFLIGIAASLILMLGFLFLFDNDAVRMDADFASTKNVDLPDGSMVTLNDGSNIEYLSTGYEKERSVSLTGEAFFEVESGNKFVVVTKHGDVEVLGTKFNVRAWGTQLLVECYEGSVMVSTSSQSSTLEASESVDIITGEMGIKYTIQHSAPLWKSGTFQFQNENLLEVFKEIERQYNVSIEYPNVNRKFSGFFNEGNLEEALTKVCNPMGLKFQIIGNKKVIISN